jgi:membrane-associated phospholipid phosphatase
MRARAVQMAGDSSQPGKQAFVALLAIALSLVAFIPQAVTAWENDVSSWDESISEALHAYENRETFLNTHVDVLGIVLHPAVQPVGFLVVLAVAGVLAAQDRRRAAWTVVLTVLGATVLGLVAKEVFARPPVDPSSTGYSFPSGHALRTMAAAGALAVVAWSTSWRWSVMIGGAIVVGLTGIAVVYHEWHWLSDVLAGWCLAIAWLGCVWLALRPPPAAN